LYSISLYGPVPMNSFSGSGAVASRFGMIAAAPLGYASSASIGAYGRFSVITTLLGLLAVTLSTYSPPKRPRGDSRIQRCSEVTTSSATIVLPS
jgi:hypothetical protein